MRPLAGNRLPGDTYRPLREELTKRSLYEFAYIIFQGFR